VKEKPEQSQKTDQPPRSEPMRPALAFSGNALVQRALAQPNTITPKDILHLQRAIGNQAIQRLLQGVQLGRSASTPPLVPSAYPRTPMPERYRHQVEQQDAGNQRTTFGQGTSLPAAPSLLQRSATSSEPIPSTSRLTLPAQSSTSPLWIQRTTKIKAPDRRSGTDLDLLTDMEVEGLIRHLKGEFGAPAFAIKYDSENAETLLARAEKKLRSRQQVTGSFNVRGRATDVSEGVVFSDDLGIREMAESYGLSAYVAEKEEMVKSIYPTYFSKWSLLLDQPSLAKTKFYGVSTALRGERDSVALPKKNAKVLYPGGDTVTSSITLTEPCKRGDEKKTRDAAMGGLSALNYAKAVGINEADKHTWEWLHLVGSAIGGGNVEGNLVAGTYDMNTLMIPLEQTIVEYSNRNDVTAFSPMKVTAVAKLYKDAKNRPIWVADTITLKVEHAGKSFWLGPIRQETRQITKVEFDFYRYVFQRMANNV
jgi:hypothetical protein